MAPSLGEPAETDQTRSAPSPQRAFGAFAISASFGVENSACSASSAHCASRVRWLTMAPSLGEPAETDQTPSPQRTFGAFAISASFGVEIRRARPPLRTAPLEFDDSRWRLRSGSPQRRIKRAPSSQRTFGAFAISASFGVEISASSASSAHSRERPGGARLGSTKTTPSIQTASAASARRESKSIPGHAMARPVSGTRRRLRSAGTPPIRSAPRSARRTAAC